MPAIPGFNGSRFLRWLRIRRVAPVNTVAPVASGTGYVGYTLSVTTGTWVESEGAAVFTYQWQRITTGGVVNLGTASTHVVTLADEGVPVRCVVTATNPGGSTAAASNTIHQWVPTDAGAVDGWWDALTTSTITVATGISAWNNKGSKAGGSLVQATAASQPAYGATAWDGVRPCATFDGTNDNVREVANTNFGRNTPGITIAATATISSTTIDRAIMSISSNLENARTSPRVLIASNLVVAGRRLDGDTFATAAPVAVTSATRLFMNQYDHANDRVRAVADGVVPAWVSPFKGAGNTSDSSSPNMNIGSSPAGNENWWHGKVGEVVHYDMLLSDADIDRLNGYLAWRWAVTANLAGGHPYKTVPPTATNVPVNLSAPVISGTGYVGYTLTATGGDWFNNPVLTYQWQRFTGGSWVSIGGATTSRHVVLVADEGLPVRCLVTATNAAGVATAASNSIEQWVPTDLGTDLENWWDAEDASTITLATGVSQWNSKGGLLDAPSQATATFQPVYSPTLWGSRPAVQFDGTNDRLIDSSSKSRGRNVAGYRVAYAAAINSATNNPDNRLYGIFGSSATRMTSGASLTQFNMGSRRLDGDAYVFTAPGGFTLDAVQRTIMSRWLFTTGEAQQRIDGTQGSAAVVFTLGNTSDTNSVSVILGGSVSGNFIGATVHEVLAIRGSGTDAENEKIEAYLAWRARLVGSLPGGHPYKTVAPTP